MESTVSFGSRIRWIPLGGLASVTLCTWVRVLADSLFKDVDGRTEYSVITWPVTTISDERALLLLFLPDASVATKCPPSEAVTAVGGSEDRQYANILLLSGGTRGGLERGTTQNRNIPKVNTNFTAKQLNNKSQKSA
jgi:hypothetical protein